MQIWTASNQNTNDLARALRTSPEKGLTTHAAQEALRTYGKNISRRETTPLWFAVLKRQVASPFVYLLVAAAGVSLLLGETIGTLFIVIFVLINVSLGFFQEYRSEQTALLLQRYVCNKARVIRDGKERLIGQDEVVPGDLLRLLPGDVIPADVRFITSESLEVDESVLSGESQTVSKTSEPSKREVHQVYDAPNLGFASTVISNGSAMALVVATGPEVIAHKISKLVVETEHVSGFQKNLAKLSRFILQLILLTLALVVVANLVLKHGSVTLADLLVFAIALAISVVPEGLPVVTTFSLSQGARRLSEKHVIVKRLSAIEDLGGIEVLCTDKTGTLTENSMSVGDVYALDGTDPVRMAALIAAPAKPHQGANPFDTALLAAANIKRTELAERLHEIPFTPARRYETVVITEQAGWRSVARGAPEAVLPLCVDLDHASRKVIEQWMRRAGEQGRRVLAVAGKQGKGAIDASKAEERLTLYGLVSFVDPIKPSTPAAIKQARQLGVQVKILTGDRPEVAAAVARQIGLISEKDRAMTGEELLALPEAEQMQAAEAYQVFARVTPEQKFHIIQLLQQQHQVGFLGEGINDAPALKISDVAVVVDEASDVARSAADIILLRKSLHVIIEGIAEGRMVFANTLKYIRATLSSNLGNFTAIAIASLFIDYLPLLPVQILFLNLLTDFPMILIATDHVDTSALSKPKSYEIRDIALISVVLGLVSALFDIIAFVAFARFAAPILQTNIFMESVLTELVFIFSVRTRGWFFKTRPSAGLVGFSLLAFVAAFTLPYASIGADIFEFVPPTFMQLATVLGLVACYFVVTEVVKVWFVRLVPSQR